MLLMYLLALLPVLIGGIMWIFNRKIVWFEWLIGCAVAFAVSLSVHLLTVYGMTHDVETWSGRVTSAVHTPYWHATWTELETYTTTDSKGNSQTHTRVVTKTRDYPPTWTARTNIGDFDITEGKYRELKQRFGEEKKVKGRRPDMDRGDPYDYHLVNKNGWLEPVVDERSWENRVKAAPSVFQFPEVPKGTAVSPYPEVTDTFRSNRLLGRAVIIDRLEFDRMNARLGPMKKVNVIMVGFPPDASSELAHWQEAAWIGGKKNDLVLCFGGGEGKTAGWSYVFGWTDEELVKRNLETILIENPIDDTILPLIEEEVRKNYRIKDWDDFNYLSIEPPGSSYIWLMVVMVITQTGLWIYFHMNSADKDNMGLETIGKKKKSKWERYGKFTWRK